MERPTPKEQALLVESADARAARTAQRLGELSLNFGRKLRGRIYPEIEIPSSLEAPNPNQVVALGKRLYKKQPLFDTFTDHAHFNPHDETSVRMYVRAANSRLKQIPTDPQARAEAEEAFDRQTEHIKDSVQGVISDDLNIARLRWASLGTVRRSIKNGQPLDNDAAVYTGDAIINFGYSLHDNPSVIRGKVWQQFPAQVIHVGLLAQEDPSALSGSPELLQLVQNEQGKRAQYWQSRLEAIDTFLGPHLTTQNIQDRALVDAEIARLNSIA